MKSRGVEVRFSLSRTPFLHLSSADVYFAAGPYAGLMPDLVPKRLYGLASGYAGERRGGRVDQGGEREERRETMS